MNLTFKLISHIVYVLQNCNLNPIFIFSLIMSFLYSFLHFLRQSKKENQFSKFIKISLDKKKSLNSLRIFFFSLTFFFTSKFVKWLHQIVLIQKFRTSTKVQQRRPFKLKTNWFNRAKSSCMIK